MKHQTHLRQGQDKQTHHPIAILIIIIVIAILIATMKGLGTRYFSYLQNHWACRALVSPALHGIRPCKAIGKDSH